MTITWLFDLANLTAFVLLTPLAIGFLRWTKARLQLRRGPGPLQVYRDLWNLLRREPRELLVPSWVFAVSPYLAAWCYVIAGAAVPVLFLPGLSDRTQFQPVSPSSDLIFLTALVGLSAFVTALGAMDSGAPFAHMGSSRAMFLHALVEVGLMLSLAALAVYGGTTNLILLITHTQRQGLAGVFEHPGLLLVGLSLIILTIAQSSRLPFDNPASHLELTMADHAMELEHSGRQWGALYAVEALRLLFLLTVLVDLFVPFFLAPIGASLPMLVLSILAYPVKLVMAILLLALWEMLQGQLRLRRALWPISAASGLAIISIVFTFVGHLLVGGR